jgi:hypothetical protein
MSLPSRRLLLIVLSLMVTGVSACAVGRVTDADDDGSTGTPTAPRGVYVPVRTGSRVTKTSFQPGGLPLPIYLNPTGGKFRAGVDDAGAGVSSVVASAGRTSVDFPGYDGGVDWDELVACVGKELSAFNVRVTDERPTSGPYIEAVVGGDGSEIGMAGYAGVAPMDTTGCHLIDRAVVFVFARQLRDLRGACEATVATIGHAASLDHTFDCTDSMSYLGGCGDRHLQDDEMACGELAERPCVCGRERQSSVDVLMQQIGPSASAAPPPGASSCGGLDYAGVCEQGVLRWCDGSLPRTLDCGAQGYDCGDTGDAALGNDCIPKQDVPDGCGGIDFLGQCSDDGVLTYCLNGELQTIDCAAIGEDCTYIDDSIGYYCTVPPAPDNCMGVDFFGECSADGNVLTYCLNGELRVINCPDQGDFVCGLIDEITGFGCVEPPPPPPPPSEPPPPSTPAQTP